MCLVSGACLQAQSKFRQFLRTYRVEQSFIYRERLQANYQQNQYFVQVDLSDLEKVRLQCRHVECGTYLIGLSHKAVPLIPVFILTGSY